VLLQHAGSLGAADEEIGPHLSETALADAVDAVPDAWLEGVPGAESSGELRVAYVRFLTARLATRAWLPRVASS